MEGKPVPGVRYRITPPSGETTEGTLNEFGQAGVYQIDPGKLQNYLLSGLKRRKLGVSIYLLSLTFSPVDIKLAQSYSLGYCVPN